MKKFVAPLLALSLVAPFALAEGDETTGTYEGSVPGRCVIKADLAGDPTLETVTEDEDNFETGFRSSDKATYRSNQDCDPEATGSVVDQPDFETLTADDVTCDIGSANVSMTTEPRELKLTFTVDDTDDYVLRAGPYEFECVITISPLL